MGANKDVGPEGIECSIGTNEYSSCAQHNTSVRLEWSREFKPSYKNVLLISHLPIKHCMKIG